jgi:hypothetical protein
MLLAVLYLPVFLFKLNKIWIYIEPRENAIYFFNEPLEPNRI